MIDQPDKTAARAAVIVYVVAFMVGAIVMSFEMLGSRYLNPYFGSGIYTWAALISTVLAALCVGYFLGGWLADRMPSMAVLGATVIMGSAYMLLVPAFADRMLELLLAGIDDVRNRQPGRLVRACCSFRSRCSACIRHSQSVCCCARSEAFRAGIGHRLRHQHVRQHRRHLGTTFYLIPLMGSRAITISVGNCAGSWPAWC